MEPLHPQVKGFILFCVQRHGKEWPALYDEMCRVAGRGLYQGLGYKELRELGLFFGLNKVEETFRKVEVALASTSGSPSQSPHS